MIVLSISVNIFSLTLLIYIFYRAIMIFLAVFGPVPISRVLLQDHSIKQVVIGSLEGIAFGVLFFFVLNNLVGPKLTILQLGDNETYWRGPSAKQQGGLLVNEKFYSIIMPRSSKLSEIPSQSHPSSPASQAVESRRHKVEKQLQIN